MQIRSRLMLFIAAFLSIGSFGASAETTDVPQIVVAYADLDLNHAAGIAALHQRIQFAAQRVCAAFDARTVDRHARYQRCAVDAAERAVNAVAVPALTQYHLARTTPKAKNERLAVAND